MNKKKKLATAGIIIGVILLMLAWWRRGRGPLILEIKSTQSHHDEISVDILIKNKGEDKPYTPLQANASVSGQLDMMATLLDGDEAYTYMEYKINGFNYTTGYAPSYGVRIDTEGLPEGWNQLLVIGYKDEKLAGVKQVIFKVDNKQEIKPRADRLGRSYGLEEVPSYKRAYIPVLMYHDFQEEISKEQESAVVHPDLFEDQLRILLASGYTPISFKDLDAYIRGEGGLPLKPIIITADDGYLSNYETAFPILKKYNVPATFFVTTRYVGVDTMSPHFTWDQAKEMEESGLIDIQSHSHGHILLSTIPDDEIRHQVDVSFGIIEQKLGRRDVKVLAYPQFYCSNNTKEILEEEGVDLQITRLARGRKPATEPTNVQRIHVANDTSPEELIKAIKKLTR